MGIKVHDRGNCSELRYCLERANRNEANRARTRDSRPPKGEGDEQPLAEQARAAGEGLSNTEGGEDVAPGMRRSLLRCSSVMMRPRSRDAALHEGSREAVISKSDETPP